MQTLLQVTGQQIKPKSWYNSIGPDSTGPNAGLQ